MKTDLNTEVNVAKKREENEDHSHSVRYGQKHNQPMEDPQALHRPDIPMPDEFGMETMQFKCWRCARVDARERHTAEAYLRNGKKLFCTACDRPDMFEWDVETLMDGTKREYLRPLTRREMHNQLSPEAHALAAKQAMAQILRRRATVILQLTAQLEVEYMGLIVAIDTAEKDVQEAEIMVSAMEKDEVGKKMANVEDLNAKIKRLVAEIAEAQKAESHRATGGN